MTDRLFFLTSTGARLYEALWVGPWPPPDKLVVMKGQQSGQVAVMEEDRVPPHIVRMARELGTITEMRFRLRNCSQITSPAGKDEHWFRGAEYVPEGDDA